MLIKGRHGGTDVKPQITCQTTVYPDYVVHRLDDINNLAFWMEIEITVAELHELVRLAKETGKDTAKADDL